MLKYVEQGQQIITFSAYWVDQSSWDENRVNTWQKKYIGELGKVENIG